MSAAVRGSDWLNDIVANHLDARRALERTFGMLLDGSDVHLPPGEEVEAFATRCAVLDAQIAIEKSLKMCRALGRKVRP